MIEHIQAQTNNTVIVAQGALSAAQQAGETKQVVQNQSQIIDTLIEDHAALRAEVAELKETLKEFISLLKETPSPSTALIDKTA